MEAKITALEQQREKEQKRQAGQVMVDDPGFVKQFLSSNYQPLKTILQAVVESGSLDGLIRKQVEDQLYFLAQQGEVAYERGWGWKLVRGDE